MRDRGFNPSNRQAKNGNNVKEGRSHHPPRENESVGIHCPKG